jgi:lysophospholipase L1-like esterase
MASAARASVSPLALRTVGNLGIRIFGGRVFNVFSLTNGSTQGTTFEVAMTTAVPFDAIRIILAGGNTTAVNALSPTIYASATAVGDLTEDTLAAATWTQATFGGSNDIGGAGQGTLATSASNARRTFTLSDIIPVASTPRTDGGTYPILVMRAYLFQTTGADGNIVLLGNGVQSFANWANHPSGRIWRMTRKIGGWALSGQAGMKVSNSTVTNASPIVGVIYYARGKVVNVAGFGDSITEGQGTYIGEGFGFPACQTLTAGSSGVAVEWSNMGWSGQSTAQIRQNIIDALAVSALKFDIAVLPCGSPNDVTTTIDPGLIANMRMRVGHMLAMLQSRGITPVVCTWMPTNTSVKTYGSTDKLRRLFNDDFRSWGGRGAVIADFDTTLSGSVDANDQTQMKIGTTDDNIHPNDAGNALLSPVLTRALKHVFSPAPGMVVS